MLLKVSLVNNSQGIPTYDRASPTESHSGRMQIAVSLALFGGFGFASSCVVFWEPYGLLFVCMAIHLSIVLSSGDFVSATVS